MTQTPRHLIAKTKKKLMVNCSQNMNYEVMYWYRQDPGLGLKLIYYSINTDIVNEGDVSDGYKASRKKKENFLLTLESASTNQTSLYLCASSENTALHSQLLTTHKGQPQEQGGSSLGRPHHNQEENLPLPSLPIEVFPDSPASGTPSHAGPLRRVLPSVTEAMSSLKWRQDTLTVSGLAPRVRASCPRKATWYARQPFLLAGLRSCPNRTSPFDPMSQQNLVSYSSSHSEMLCHLEEQRLLDCLPTLTSLIFLSSAKDPAIYPNAQARDILSFHV